MSMAVPAQLRILLEELGLIDARRLARHARAARRLARGLPLLDSVWLDAMVRSRAITPLQAEAIEQGDARRLAVGPYLLREHVATLGYAQVYAAEERRERDRVHLTLCEQSGDEEGLERLRAMTDAASRLREAGLVPPCGVGREGDRLWIASRPPRGESAHEWLIHYGRMQPDAVLEIARDMAASLGVLEEEGFAHGDISTRNLLLGRDGRAWLLHAGVRGAVRPREGIGTADLAPSFFETLAPERVGRGALIDHRSDMFACACIWYRLLTGRPLFAGGDALSVMKAILENAMSADDAVADQFDVRRFEPQTPPVLAEVMRECLSIMPDARPASMREVKERLGGEPSRTSPSFGKRWTHRRSVFASAWAGLRRFAPAAGRPSSNVKPTSSDRGSWLRNATLLTAGIVIGALATFAVSPAPEDVEPTKDAAPREMARATEMSALQAPNAGQAPADSVQGPLPGAPAEASAAQQMPDVEVIRLPDRAVIDAARIVLPGEKPVILTSVGRTTLVVSDQSLVARAPEVIVENIDFVRRASSAGPAGADALVWTTAPNTVFRGCAFHDQAGGAVAVHWSSMSKGSVSGWRLLLSDCVLHGVAESVRCEISGVAGVEMRNTWYAGAGPMLTVARPLSDNDAMLVTLRDTTCRSEGGFVRYAYDGADAPRRGSIRFNVDRSVFALGGPLFEFLGESSPDAWSRSLAWNGSDAILVEEAPVAQWRKTDTNEVRPIDDFSMDINGLVRGKLVFAEDSSGESVGRLTSWLAPLHKDGPPGADPSRLPPIPE